MASFVERATLLLNDQSSGSIKKINNELKQLFATANKLRSMKFDLKVNTTSINRAKAQVQSLEKLMNNLGKARSTSRTPLVSSRETQTIRALMTEAREAEAAVKQIGQGQPSSGLRAAHSMLREMVKDARAAQQALSGFGRAGARRGGAGPNVPPVAPPGRQEVLPRPRWGRSIGQDIAFGFKASVGNAFFQGLNSAGRSAGQGILTADDARAIASVSGVDVDRLAASVSRATDKTKGVSQGAILEAATEQAAQLTVQLRKGTITSAQFDQRLDETTRRIAENAQIFTTFSHDAAAGAESARQLEKALAVSGAFTPQDKESTNRVLRQAIIAAGGDISANEAKRSLQQLGGAQATGLSERGIANLILTRDEGGARSTAEIRGFIDALVRSNKTLKDQTKQKRAGLRDPSGVTTLTPDELGDPISIVRDKIIPKLKKLGVDLTNANAVATGMQKLGFTSSEARFVARVVPNIGQFEQDLARSQNIRPEQLVQQPTLRVELANIEAKFQDAAVSLTSSLLPAIKETSAGLADTFKAVSKGEVPTAKQLGGIATAGLAAAAIAFMDPATRPLAAAAIALDGSAAALTAAAAAQTVAAGGGLLGKLGKGFGLGALLATSLGALKLGMDQDQARINAGDKNTLLGGIRDIFKGAREQIKLREDRAGEDRITRANTPENISATATAIAAAVARQRIGTEDRLTRVRTTPESTRQLQSIQSDNLVIKNLPVLNQQDRGRANPSLKLGQVPDNVGAPGGNEFDKMLAGMDRSASTIEAAFGTGGTQAGASLESGLTTGGGAAASSIQSGLAAGGGSVAAQIQQALAAGGAAVASAISGAVANVSVNVKQTTPAANLGSSHPGKD